VGRPTPTLPVPVVVEVALTRPLGTVRTMLGTDAPTDPESIHRARTSTRRLRSNLQTLTSALEASHEVREDLAWIGESLGVVRDADVLLERLAARVRAAPSPVARGAQVLAPSIDAHRRAAEERLRRDLASVRFGTLIRELDVLVKEGSSAEDAIDAATAMRPRWRSLREAVAAAEGDPSDPRLHAVRIAAKRVRYAAEMFEQAGGGRRRRFIRRVTAMQDVLGAQHDAARASEWLVSLDVGDARTARAAGWFAADAAAEREALREAWGPAWGAVRAGKARFW
jgi:CHAD domain-containing protein